MRVLAPSSAVASTASSENLVVLGRAPPASARNRARWRRLRPRRDRALAQSSVGHDEVGSMAQLVPSPSQVGQAPKGLLNENSRGSISSMVKPETGQANFSENSDALVRLVSFLASLLADSFAAFLGLLGRACRRIRRRRGRRPASARSRNCRRARGDIAATTMRSTTTSMSCLNFLSSAGASAIS
jgi:hypothetical protein